MIWTQVVLITWESHTFVDVNLRGETNYTLFQADVAFSLNSVVWNRGLFSITVLKMWVESVVISMDGRNVKWFQCNSDFGIYSGEIFLGNSSFVVITAVTIKVQEIFSVQGSVWIETMYLISRCRPRPLNMRSGCTLLHRFLRIFTFYLHCSLRLRMYAMCIDLKNKSVRVKERWCTWWIGSSRSLICAKAGAVIWFVLAKTNARKRALGR